MTQPRAALRLILFALATAGTAHAETPRETSASLIRKLQSADIEQRREIAGRLVKIGLEARDAIPWLVHIDSESEYGSIWWYGHDLGAEPVPALCRVVRETTGKSRERAIRALGELQGDAALAVPLLIELMSDLQQPPAVRVAAAQSAARIGAQTERVVTALGAMLVDENRKIATAAADAIGDLAYLAASASSCMARAAVQHPDPHVRQRCILFLADVDPNRRRVAKTLARALSDTQRIGGWWAPNHLYTAAIDELLALGADARPAVPAMLEVLRTDRIRSSNWSYRNLTSALANCRAEKAVLLLEADIRPKASRKVPPWHPILGRLGEYEPSEGELPYLRVLAAKALIRLVPDHEDAFATLMEVFTDQQWGNGTDPLPKLGKFMNPREEAAAGLGYCQKWRTRVIPLLRAARAEEGSRDFQAVCAWSLARLGAENIKPLPLLAHRLHLYPGLQSVEYAGLLGDEAQQYVPELIESALSYERERSVYFLSVLRKTKPDSINRLAREAARHLVKDDFGRQEDVLVALGGRASPAIPLLLEGLQSDDWRTRARVCRALGRMTLASDKVLPVLARSSRDPRPLVRARAVEAIGRYGPQARCYLDKIRGMQREDYLTIRLAAHFAIRSLRGSATPRQLPRGFDPLKSDGLAAKVDINRLRQIEDHRRSWHESLVELGKPDTDRAAITRQLRTLIDQEVVLRTERNQEVVRRFETTVAPSDAKPGTIEASMDALADMTEVRSEGDARILKLIRQHGFEALPKLVEHYDDPRLTRWSDSIFHEETLGFVPVGGVVRQVLNQMSTEMFDFKDAEFARDWWKRTRPLGEEEYLKRVVIDRAVRGDLVGESLWVWAGDKVPGKVAAAYRQVLADGNHRSRPLAEAVARSSLSNGRKAEVLLAGLKQEKFGHRWAALGQLLNLDEARFREIAIEQIDQLPLRAEEPADLRQTFWATLELGNSGDEQIWDHFLQHVRRADVVLRIEFVASADYSGINPRSRDRRIEFAAKFLDDPQLRIVGREARVRAPQFRRLEVRDMAAWSLATLLELSAEPDQAWTDQQWRDLRVRVKKALHKRGSRTRP